MRTFVRGFIYTALSALVACASIAQGQDSGSRLDPTPLFDLSTGPLTLRGPAIPNHPFTVTGRSGAILGMQDGTTELWQLPVKFFSALHLRVEIDGYPVPIDLNTQAASLEVSPDHTTLTYAHAAVSVRQHMFVPAGEGNAGLGGMIVFEIQALHSLTLTISLTPAMVREWPAPQFGTPGASWHAMGDSGARGGAYVLSTDNPHLFGMIGMANTQPGVLSPYQERPTSLPLEFKLRFDPAKDSNHLFPLLCEVNHADELNGEAAVNAMAARLTHLAAELPAIYARTQSYYAHFFDTRLVPHTPNPQLDLALRWAELAIDKSQVTTDGGAGDGETGLVAGWYPSFDSARPGFGWYFGRDTLWSMYAIDSYGDRELAQHAFEFLIKRQRADGKMPHEWSLSAGSLTGELAWQNFPYEYASADGTPLYLLAMRDYLRASGDVDFLRKHWASLQLAYRFERTHDSDGDGVYDNSQGTGWVEDWPKQPHQELYLASLDHDATLAMAELADSMGNASLAAEASSSANKIAAVLDSYRRPDGTYAFSKNADGRFDPTLTVYPSVGLWFSPKGLPQATAMLDAWAGNHFSTDWGTRALADNDPTYDPISYHRGTVWPLFTGWTSLAEYNSDRPLAGYAMLRRNAGLTWAQDPGAVTELLSGRFYQTLGRSSTHQLWSSAMTLAPALRGLFGLAPDAVAHTLFVHPHLPADWPEATLDHLRVGGELYTVSFHRGNGRLVVTAKSEAATVLCLRDMLPSTGTAHLPCNEPPAITHQIVLTLAAVEVEPLPATLPSPGSETTQARIVGEQYDSHELAFTLEAQGGTAIDLKVHCNAKVNPHVEGGVLTGGTLHVQLPSGQGFVSKPVTLRW